MTPRELRDDLQRRLSHLLGTYTLPGGATIPALWSGEPPSDYKASGIEVRIGTDAELSAQALQNSEYHLHGTLTVRIVGWGGASLTEAVQRTLAAYPLASTAYIPESEDIGIINQAIIRIPTA